MRAASPEVEASFRGPLVRAGARLLRRRRDLLAEIAPRLERAFREISGPLAPAARLGYRAAGEMSWDGTEDEIAGRLASRLAQRVTRDGERGFTSVGPHMDDLTLRRPL